MRYEKERNELVWYSLDEGLHKITFDYSSQDSDLSSLNGYFEHSQKLGKIEITPFKFSIWSISFNYTYETSFQLNEWELLLHLFSNSAPEIPIKTLLGNFKNLEFSKKKMMKRLSKIEW